MIKYINSKENTYHWLIETVCFKRGIVQITNNRDKVIKIAEEFYRKLYSSSDKQTEDSSMETMNTEIPSRKHQKYKYNNTNSR